VNESAYKFTVNEKGEVRFGLGAIKNMGEAAAGSILEERISNGHYKSVFDFLVRSNLRSINKRNIEALATSGAFDSFEGIHRAQFFYKEGNDNQSFLEKLIRNATQTQEAKNSAQFNLFGEVSEVEVSEPTFPQCDHWSKMRELQEELDSIGFYISAHPMDSYKIPIRYFTNTSIQQINASIQEMKGHQLKFAAQVTSAEHLTSQQGNNYCRFKVEDHNAGIELMVFSELYLKIKHLIDPGLFVLINASPAPSYRDKEKMELKINDIQLLDRVVETSGRTIYLKLDVNRMTDDDLLLLQETIQAHLDGKNPYSIQFIDHTNKMLSTLTPKKGRLNANHFLPLVDAFDFVSYDLK
jgi:DNA polymerase-3 subunit alpha